jgi:glutamate synthase (NADPH) small chain
VRFETDVVVGVDISARYLSKNYDAIVLTTGARVPRDLDVPGRDLKGVHFALNFLTQQNRLNAGDEIPEDERIVAQGKHVVVVGGGDTGSDCIGTSIRQGAASVTQIELLPQPPEKPTESNPWPTWPVIMRTSSAHEEGCERLWSIGAQEVLSDDSGNCRALRCARLDWSEPDQDGRMRFEEIPDSAFEIKADLMLLAMGFVHTEHGPLVQDLNLETDPRGNVLVDPHFMTTTPGVFAGGDTVKGASLIVHAIALGRDVAAAVDEFLTESKL